MKSIEEIRQENLRTLRKDLGKGVLCEKLQRSDSQISQWINGSKHSDTGKPRHMKSATARWIEACCGMPENWLDIDHNRNTPYDINQKVTSVAQERATRYDTWPFDRITIGRFSALPLEERIFIEGRLLEAIIDAETRSQKRRAS